MYVSDHERDTQKYLSDGKDSSMKKSIFVVFGIAISLLLASSNVVAQRISLASINVTGSGGGNEPSHFPAISADGRFVAFTSEASNLVPNDNNGKTDVFVRDTATGTTMLVSASVTAESGNNDSSAFVLSANGQFVAFSSNASNLVLHDNNNAQDIFVKNLLTGTTLLVSVNTGGLGSANSVSFRPQISADGRYVGFVSIASDIVSNDTNGYIPDIFVRDMQTGTTELVSVDLSGGSSSTDSSSFALSANGRVVAFPSDASDLVIGDGNRSTDVFVRNLDTATTAAVSVNRRRRTGNGPSFTPTISVDGRFVAFWSAARDLTGNDTNTIGDVFVRDTLTATTTLASVNRTGLSHNSVQGIWWAAISQNGRVVLFAAWDSDIVEDDTNNRLDIFARDLSTGSTKMVSAKVPRYGDLTLETTRFTKPVISNDGRFVVFSVGRGWDWYAQKNAYVRDLLTDSITLINTNSGYSGVDNPAISGDGRLITFDAYANDLLPNVGPGNVYVYDSISTAIVKN